MTGIARAGAGRRRWALGLMAVAGATLVAVPVGSGMFARAPKGAAMLTAFRPFMTTARLAGFQADIGAVNAGVHEARTRVARYLTRRSGSPRPFATRFPEFASFAPVWPAINRSMAGLIARIQARLPDYRAMAALPSFTLFPWFLLIPGVLLLGLVGAALAGAPWSWIRRLALGLGACLVLAPIAFQMFSRAPAGARMMGAFRTIETRRQVETIQGYFGTIGLGQGAIRLQLVPALERTGLSSAEIAARFPSVAALDRRWVAIIGDMTPMIGAMSDNVANYQALTSLPPFTVFPWLFAVSGLLVAAAGWRGGRRPAAAAATELGRPQPRGAT
jgi:hypothetical protein